MLVVLRAVILPLFVDGSAEGTGNGAGEFAEELLQGGNSGGGEIRAGDGYVHVEVGDGAIEGIGVLLDPLRGAHETLFLGVPTAEDNCAFGAPTLAKQRADAVD